MRDKKDVVAHMLYVLEETVMHLQESAEDEREVKILENEIKRLTRRRLNLEAKR